MMMMMTLNEVEVLSVHDNSKQNETLQAITKQTGLLDYPCQHFHWIPHYCPYHQQTFHLLHCKQPQKCLFTSFCIGGILGTHSSFKILKKKKGSKHCKAKKSLSRCFEENLLVTWLLGLALVSNTEDLVGSVTRCFRLLCGYCGVLPTCRLSVPVALKQTSTNWHLKWPKGVIWAGIQVSGFVL